MPTKTNTNDLELNETEESAQAEIDRIEQDAIDGKPVTPSTLAAARERLTLAGLRRKGREQRAAKAQAAREAQERAKAKTAAAALFTDETRALEDAKAAVEAGLQAVLAAVDEHNEKFRAAAKLFAEADVTSGLMDSDYQPRNDGIENLDTDNHAAYHSEPGYNDLMAVIIGGVTHYRKDPIDTLRMLLHDGIKDPRIRSAVVNN